MRTRTGVTKNLWRRTQNGVYAPSRMNAPTNGLVVFAPLWHPELSGSPFNAWDVVNNTVRACTVTGATWDIQGRTFDGTDDAINCGSPTALDNIGTAGDYTFSLVAWIKPSGLGENNQGRIVDKNKFYLRMEGEVGNTHIALRTYNSTVAKNAVSASNSTPIGSWSHVVAIYDGANLKTYVNEILVIGDATTGTLDNHATSDLRIGDGASSAVCFNGTIGEVLIYNRALSVSEVSNLYLTTKWRYQ